MVWNRHLIDLDINVSIRELYNGQNICIIYSVIMTVTVTNVLLHKYSCKACLNMLILYLVMSLSTLKHTGLTKSLPLWRSVPLPNSKQFLCLQISPAHIVPCLPLSFSWKLSFPILCKWPNHCSWDFFVVSATEEGRSTLNENLILTFWILSGQIFSYTLLKCLFSLLCIALKLLELSVYVSLACV